MADESPAGRTAAVNFPRAQPRPLVAVMRRVGMGATLILLIAVVVYVDRGGYTDDADGDVGALDAFYYATVSITTTGYGDITPVTPRARLITSLVVTPARVAFLILLVGTTLEILTERSREAFRLQRWRKRVRDHYIVCGFGTKGRSAVDVLTGRGVDPSRIVVVDEQRDAVEEATAAGLVAVQGSAARTAVLHEAGVGRARAVVVAPHRDEASVLITLTARELNPAATIVAAVREKENAHLLRQSGADAVITSAEASGRLLGMATQDPQLVDVIEDLLTAGEGLDISERPVRDAEVQAGHALVGPGELVVATVRDGVTLPFVDARGQQLRPGDQLVIVSVGEPPTGPVVPGRERT